MEPRLPADNFTVLLIVGTRALRNGVTAWLSHEFPHCHIAAAATLQGAASMIAAQTPDVVLVDIDARHGEGFEALRALRAGLPDAALIALSIFEVDYFRDAAVGAGAMACACIALSDDSLRDLLRGLLPRIDGGRA